MGGPFFRRHEHVCARSPLLSSKCEVSPLIRRETSEKMKARITASYAEWPSNLKISSTWVVVADLSWCCASNGRCTLGDIHDLVAGLAVTPILLQELLLGRLLQLSQR